MSRAAAVNHDYFDNRFFHPGSRLVVYRRDPREGTDPGDCANQLPQQLPARATVKPVWHITGVSRL